MNRPSPTRNGPSPTGQALPDWLREGLEGELTDTCPNKRREPRHVWVSFAFGKPSDAAAAKPFTVKTFNVGEGGIGFISRKHVPEGRILEISPDEDLGEAIRVRVMHCTQTIQGYKVGCTIENS